MFKRRLRTHWFVARLWRTLVGGVAFGFCVLTACVPDGLSGLTGADSTSTPEPSTTLPSLSADGTIAPAGADEPAATVSFEARPVFCCNPLTMTFTAQVADAGELNGARFTWLFGDDRTAAGPESEHTFTRAGTYSVRLTVRLSDGTELLADRSVSVGTSSRPAAGAYSVDAGPNQSALGGTVVTLSGSVSPEDPDAAVSWRQRSGSAVPLNGTNLNVATFEAPEVGAEPVALAFEFAVVDGPSDVVEVMVWASNLDTSSNVPPFVFDCDLEVAPNQTGQVVIRATDFEGDTLTLELTDGPSHGLLTEIGTTATGQWTWQYTPDQDFIGADEFSFTCSDAQGVSNVGVCRISVVGPSVDLAATDAAYLVVKNTPSRITLSGAWSDGASPGFRVLLPPTHGSLGPITVGPNQPGTVVYTPPLGFEGEDRFEFVVDDGVSTSPPGVVTIRVAKLLAPWIEVNAPTDLASDRYTAAQGAEPGMTMVDYCLAGLEHWSTVTDTVFVSTMPGQSGHLYPELMRRKPPHIRIIGGLKTVRLPGGMPEDTRPFNFADADEWLAIGAEAEDIVRYTGMTTVLLENETALGRFTFGEVSIDYTQLHNALGALRGNGVQFWWNLPRLLPDIPEFPDRLSESTAFVATIADALPDSVFLGGYTAWYDWRFQLELRDTMRAMLGDSRIQERLLVTPDGYFHLIDLDKRSFTPSEAIERTTALTGTSANIYPGVENWILVGESFATLLPPLAKPLR